MQPAALRIALSANAITHTDLRKVRSAGTDLLWTYNPNAANNSSIRR